jgi:hypothetical protein
MFFLPEAPFDIVVYPSALSLMGLPGRNLKATQCGCVIDHAEAPKPLPKAEGASPQSPGWSG